MMPAGQSRPGPRMAADDFGPRQREAEAESSSGEEESSDGGCICLQASTLRRCAGTATAAAPLPVLPAAALRLHQGLEPSLADTAGLKLCNTAAADAAESSSDEDQQPLAQRGWAAKHALPQPTAPARTRHNRFPKIPKCAPALPAHSCMLPHQRSARQHHSAR